MGVTELTLALHEHARDRFREWFQLFAVKPSATDTRPQRPDLNFIVAGFELNHDPKIYRMSSSLDFAPMLHNYGFGVDGVAQYALYLISRLYDPRSSTQGLECLAAYLIAETASQDGKVGGAIQILTMATGDPHFLTESAVDAIVLRNKERSWALKQSFMENVELTDSESMAPAHMPAFNQQLQELSVVSANSIGVSEGLIEEFSIGINW